MRPKLQGITAQTLGFASLLFCGCTSIDDAGVFIARSDVYACADVDYGAVEDGLGQVRAEVVAQVYEHAGGASQQLYIPMERIRSRDGKITYGSSKRLTVPRACVTRLYGNFLFEASAGGRLGTVRKERRVESDISRLVRISIGRAARPGYGEPHEVVVSLPCPLTVPAVVHLSVSGRRNPSSDGTPTTFTATINPERLDFSPGTTRQVATLRVDAADPGDEFGVIATVTGDLEVTGDRVDVGCSASCVGIYCFTCEEQYAACGDIGRDYCGMPPTSCENWPDGI